MVDTAWAVAAAPISKQKALAELCRQLEALAADAQRDDIEDDAEQLNVAAQADSSALSIDPDITRRVTSVSPTEVALLSRCADILRGAAGVSMERAARKPLAPIVDTTLLPLLSNAASESADPLGAVDAATRAAARAGIAAAPMRVWVAAVLALGSTGDVHRLRRVISGLADASAAGISLRELCARLPADARLALLSCYPAVCFDHTEPQRGGRAQPEHQHWTVLRPVAELVAVELELCFSSAAAPRCAFGPLLSLSLASRVVYQLAFRLGRFVEAGGDLFEVVQQPQQDDVAEMGVALHLCRRVFLGTLRALATGQGNLLAADAASQRQNQRRSKVTAVDLAPAAAAATTVSVSSAYFVELGDERAAAAWFLLDATRALLQMGELFGADFAVAPETTELIGGALCQLLPFLGPQDRSALALCATILEHLLSLGCLRPALDVATIWVAACPELVDHTTFPLSLVESLIAATAAVGGCAQSVAAAADFSRDHLRPLVRLYHARGWLQSVVRGDGLQRQKAAVASHAARVLNPFADSAAEPEDVDANGGGSALSLSSAWFSAHQSTALLQSCVRDEEHAVLHETYGLVVAPGGLLVPARGANKNSVAL